ncbi:hypothetical protein ACFE04_026563 [Oxalis oulophora]
MAMLAYSFMLWLSLILIYGYTNSVHATVAHLPAGGRQTRFYDFKVQMKKIKKLCNSTEIVTINQMYPGPTIYAEEDDLIIVKVTNQTPQNITIHWHGVRQILSCWFDGPSYITQCPIQSGQSFTYKFTMVKQKGTFFWHAHASWLRATVHGALIVKPKPGVHYPFKFYEEKIVILGEYWQQDMVKLERQTMDSGGAPQIADAFTINGHPGPNYNCSRNDVYKIDVVPGKTYMLRLINAALNIEHYFSIANHNLTIVEADAEYVKPFTTDVLMLGPGQTMNVLVKADQSIGIYSMAMGPYMTTLGLAWQNTSSVAYFQYLDANLDSSPLPASLPLHDDSSPVKTIMDGLKSLTPAVDIPKEIDTNMFMVISLNAQKCMSKTPQKNCKGLNNSVFSASMNNISFSLPSVSILDAYYRDIDEIFTEDFPDAPLKFYDFVNGAPNSVTYDTSALIGTRVKVLEYGTNVQMIFQDTNTLGTENHPIHLHGYSFYVVGYGTGNYDSQTAKFNLEDPPYMNTIGVPKGGWAAIRFKADNPGVWFMHCHLEIHTSFGLSTTFIVKNGKGVLQTLPQPPTDLPLC